MKDKELLCTMNQELTQTLKEALQEKMERNDSDNKAVLDETYKAICEVEQKLSSGK